MRLKIGNLDRLQAIRDTSCLGVPRYLGRLARGRRLDAPPLGHKRGQPSRASQSGVNFRASRVPRTPGRASSLCNREPCEPVVWPQLSDLLDAPSVPGPGDPTSCDNATRPTPARPPPLVVRRARVPRTCSLSPLSSPCLLGSAAAAAPLACPSPAPQPACTARPADAGVDVDVDADADVLLMMVSNPPGRRGLSMSSAGHPPTRPLCPRLSISHYEYHIRATLMNILPSSNLPRSPLTQYHGAQTPWP